ncbi:hypothetical protein F4803DRAFT_182766 [Xylaria telfairii]|nr:hypothetical protein F4803DRAFT_182766 [Xylaria telfairii]
MALLPPCLLTYTTCTCTVPLVYIALMYLLLPALVYMYLALQLLWRTILQFAGLRWSSTLPYQIAWAAPCLMLLDAVSQRLVPAMYLAHFEFLSHTAFLACLCAHCAGKREEGEIHRHTNMSSGCHLIHLFAAAADSYFTCQPAAGPDPTTADTSAFRFLASNAVACEAAP